MPASGVICPWERDRLTGRWRLFGVWLRCVVASAPSIAHVCGRRRGVFGDRGWELRLEGFGSCCLDGYAHDHSGWLLSCGVGRRREGSGCAIRRRLA